MCPILASYVDILILKTTINVSKLPWCNRSSLARWRCYGSPSPGIVGCFALYLRNLLLNTSIAHSIKQNPSHSKGIHPLTLKCTIWKDSEDMIQSLNQLHYITSDQSHSVKARKIQPLAKPFRLFSRVCENCIIKTNVQSHLL